MSAWADHLKNTDEIGKIEPYFTVNIGSREMYRSSYAMKGSRVVWPSAKFDVPTSTDEILVKVFEYDEGKEDDYLGNVTIPLPLVEGECYDLGDGQQFILGKGKQPTHSRFQEYCKSS